MMTKFLKVLIRGYQVALSPFWGAQCRFHPTCSCYAMEAIEKHGALKGVGLSIYRIMRCNPWSKGGIDLVPEKVIKK